MKSVAKIIVIMSALYTGSEPSTNPLPPPNRLIHATSPYLLQHAHNPVDWYEWGPEAMTKAISEDKPILVSIGYSSCHWCHVMERESFENEEVAKIMNENFVCIKVDREERPDIDQIYMEAVQAMGLNGGWPLNVFLTPEQKPFYGGTYFPASNWVNLLRQLSKAFRQNRDEINSNAEQLTQHLQQDDVDRFTKDPNLIGFEAAALDSMYAQLHSRFDPVWGGLSRAPKFVMPAQWAFLLRYHRLNPNSAALDMVTQTLNKVATGGIYDQLGGGFARYSVDAQWFAPHFEKMLYDNAQLVSLYSEAFLATGNDFYREVVSQTIGWLTREMMSSEGGFYSALDADSEGEEGKFYVWTKGEVDSIATNAPWLSMYYSVTDSGNWEPGKNILHVARDKKTFCEEHHQDSAAFDQALEVAKADLMKARATRTRPSLDDKIVTSWNAMMTTGLLDAYVAFDNGEYLQLARKNLNFIETHLFNNEILFRSYKGKRSTTAGFLEDYAFLIAAYIKMYQVTFEEDWLVKAKSLTLYVLDHFTDSKDGFFHSTSAQAEKLIARKKEVFDNVIPSSNGVMARNLFHLGILLDNEAFQKNAYAMVKSLGEVISKEPTYMAYWATTYLDMVHEPAEVVLVGPKALKTSLDMQRHFVPDALFMGTASESHLPLIEGKTNPQGDVTIYVCYHKTCKHPVSKIAEAMEQLKR